MIEVKLYLYDSGAEGYRGRDLTAFLLAGAQNTENLTEELDKGELTLAGFDERREFAPETKLIVDVYEDGTRVATYHRIVDEDVVEQPILSDDEYFNHSITLLEPSAIAQKRVVDNIAVTYKLKDVSLEIRPTFDIDEIAQMDLSEVPPVPQRGFRNYVDETNFSSTRNTSFGKYYIWKNTDNSDQIKVIYTRASDSVTDESDKYYNNVNDIKEVSGKRYVQFELPAPYIMWGRKDVLNKPPQLLNPAYGEIGIASFSCTITETAPNGEQTVFPSQTFISNSNLGASHDTDFPYDFAVQSYPTGKANFVAEYLLEEEKVQYYQETGPSGGLRDHHDFLFYFARYTDTANGTDYRSQNAITSPIEVKENCTYTVQLSVLNLATAAGGVPITMYPHTTQVYYYNALVYQGSGARGFCYIKDKTGFSPYATNVYDPANYLPRNNYAPSVGFHFYRADGRTIMLASGIEYSALNLIKKAIIASDTYFKESNEYSVVDFEHPNVYPFYIQSGDGDGSTVTTEDLALIRVNEAFYHQKNLWEILLEVGKYAHAIPQIMFGDDDKFAISFYKLGTTNLKADENTRVSVMNFRKIDDYVSACSSYIDNLVQLGGKIVETVPPKTTHEQYLVYNDTAEVITAKPIMELLSLKAVATHYDTYEYGDERADIYPGLEIDLTAYVFEKNVYNLLSIEYNEVPNKGIALYYELGENVIKGGDYQLPQAVTNAYSDYSFKKAIFSAALSNPQDAPYGGYPTNVSTVGGTGPWYDIKITDFVFKVEYRTKDSARVEHCRPDLRHYLLMSKYDKVPMHRQFNNQEDILVDSVAFGANMFGKLIRTGNANYKIREWCPSYATVKHKGELYAIDGDLYYVARVTNIFFPDHIESVVEYSRDYNQLSEIIGIPSSPRFYEISEQSTIDREVAINDYLLVTTTAENIDSEAGLIADIEHTKDLIFSTGTTYLKWAKTTFKGDPQMDSALYGTFGVKDFEKATLSPVSAYSCGNTLTYEWDMVDNLSAGDKILAEGATDDHDQQNPAPDKIYRPMRAVQYCDVYGKATLCDIELYGDLSLTYAEIRAIPEAPTLDPANAVIRNDKSIVLLKDCRETLHFNYNLMQITDSDTFVLSPFFFSDSKKNGVKIVLLAEEVNKLANGFISPSSILAEELNPMITVSGNAIAIAMAWVNNVPSNTRQKAKSIVIMEKEQPTQSLQKFILAKNGAVYGVTWYLGAPNKNAIWNAQNGNKQ